jgi:hypothetical protein
MTGHQRRDGHPVADRHRIDALAQASHHTGEFVTQDQWVKVGSVRQHPRYVRTADTGCLNVNENLTWARYWIGKFFVTDVVGTV